MKKQSQPSFGESLATLVLAIPVLLLGLGVFALFGFVAWSFIASLFS